MTAKHTPIPWIISGQNILAGDGIGIAKVYDNIGQPREANARLIAAAPEMLEALEMLLNETNAGTWDCLPVDRASNAIRKARGE